jgi:hypothetical protein
MNKALSVVTTTLLLLLIANVFGQISKIKAVISNQ